MRKALVVLAVLVIGVAIVVIWQAGKDTPSTPTASATALDTLRVAPAGTMKGYSREKFPHWTGTTSGCDVRDEVLVRDGQGVKRTATCRITGIWVSPYTGGTIRTSSAVDVDHVVPLANAWRSGANTWSTSERKDFANDMARHQLKAVDAASNRQKGDQDPSTWKPKLASYHCQYARDWVGVKAHYQLSVTMAEKAALAEMLATCKQ